MNLKYTLGAIIAVPLLPIMYIQGKKIKASVPSLPEAEGTEGGVFTNENRTINVLTIGESTIAGVGVSTHEEGFSGALGRELSAKLEVNTKWKVYAKSGINAKRVAEEIVQKITETAVDLIVIGLGANDAFELNTPSKWRVQIAQLIDLLQIKFKDAPIVFLNMPPIKEFPAFTPLIRFVVGNLVDILGNELKSLVLEKENVYFYARKITLKDWSERLKVVGKPSDYFSDGIHPSKLVYQTWAMDLVDYLSENDDFLIRFKQQSAPSVK